MAVRHLTEEPLRVAAGLQGVELASPLRRLVAWVIDTALMAVPSIALALGAAWFSLHLTEPRALRGLEQIVSRKSADASVLRASLIEALPLLARHHAPGLPPKAMALVDEGRTGEAAELLIQEGYDFLFALNVGEYGQPPLPPKTIKVDVGHLIPEALRALAVYGALGAYFTLMTAWGGRTIGKRLLGIRVTRLDGHRLSLAESLERFIGYLHIPGSFGLSLLDLWRDPNRRLPHDRVVHTAVVRVRRLPRPARAAAR